MRLQDESKDSTAPMPSTSMRPGGRSGADWLASRPAAERDAWLADLTDGEALALPFLFEFWAFDHQLPPPGDWRSWVILGGRGAGKTRAGSEWVRSMVEGSRPLDKGRAARVALVGETYEQVRDVMVFGDSGILACSPPDRRPVWEAGRRRLVWPNGAVASAFSASDPEALRGPQFDAAWADELAKWKKGQDAWDMLQFALRLGDDPRCVVTTTPRTAPALKALLASPSTVQTHAPTEANLHLPENFLQEVHARYAGTRLGRQELDGILLEDVDGALWTHAMLDRARVRQAPALDRIVVAVDPPVSAHEGSDACGIVVAGVSMQGPPSEWTAWVLEDATVQGASPTGWAQAAVDAMDRWGADRLVAEVNQGGALVEQVVRQVAPQVSYRAVRASKGKTARAEPVAALYERGRVRHAGGFAELEDQMCRMSISGYQGRGSPDRVDALVWALWALLVDPASSGMQARVRLL